MLNIDFLKEITNNVKKVNDLSKLLFVSFSVMEAILHKGSPKNKFVKFTLRFRFGLRNTIEQSHPAKSGIISRPLRVSIVQIRPEAEMRNGKLFLDEPWG
jgi:hypothetical protein